jgi:hypothetical protein
VAGLDLGTPSPTGSSTTGPGRPTCAASRPPRVQSKKITRATHRGLARVIGPVVDVEFPPGDLPEINNALTFDRERPSGRDRDADRRGRPAHRRQPRARHLHAADRRRGPRRARAPTPAPRSRCRSAGTSATSTTCSASRWTSTARSRRHLLADPPRPAGVRRARAAGRDVRDRHQGHRPGRALRPGRQDRHVRRRRRRQDRRHPGDDQPRRPAARWRVGVRRRRRAHPRGQRPVLEMEESGVSRRPRWSSGRWTSRRACACASRCRR